MKLSSLLLCAALLTAAVPRDARAGDGPVRFATDPTTGAIASLTLAGDTTGMNWMLRTDGSQYAWVTSKYGWGLGYFTAGGRTLSWHTPESVADGGRRVVYTAGGVRVEVERSEAGGGFAERYTFVNKGTAPVRLTDLGIYTPFNDNYPDARTCLRERCHAHIWPGGAAAWVEARRMSGRGAEVGLMLTQGNVVDYDIWERGPERGASNFRGVVALCPADTTLGPGGRMTVGWRVFACDGPEGFRRSVLRYGGALAEADRYVATVGDTVRVALHTARGTRHRDVRIGRTGEHTVALDLGGGRQTCVRLLGIPAPEELVARRVAFILDHQQMNDTADARYGAFMVYDNETGRIYLNDDDRASHDTDEGRERVGMGLLLAKWCTLHPDARLRGALVRYAAFVRRELQTADYTTYSQTGRRGYHRGYNYPWVADFYFHMYDLTGDARYAADGYGTLCAFFRHFGYGFYAIDIPVLESMKALERAGMSAERDTLLAHYRRTAARFAKTGPLFPRHEVNYEQSIVAPAVAFMAEMYLQTADTACLAYVRRLMPALEAFAGSQPAYNLNGIAIRHWDGYWFGKRPLYGDTFPHYWSTLNAVAYYYYARCGGGDDYLRRARAIVRGNLCLFAPDGRASCAYLAPRRVDRRPGHYYDPFANDQDWALAFYLLVEHGI